MIAGAPREAAPPLDSQSQSDLEPDDQIVRAINHPLRRGILRSLSAGSERSLCELQALLNCELSDLAYHLAVLAEINAVARPMTSEAGYRIASAVAEDGWFSLVLIATQGRDEGW